MTETIDLPSGPPSVHLYLELLDGKDEFDRQSINFYQIIDKVNPYYSSKIVFKLNQSSYLHFQSLSSLSKC